MSESEKFKGDVPGPVDDKKEKALVPGEREDHHLRLIQAAGISMKIKQAFEKDYDKYMFEQNRFKLHPDLTREKMEAVRKAYLELRRIAEELAIDISDV